MRKINNVFKIINNYLLCIPALLFVIVFLFVPVIENIYYSFFKWDGLSEPIFIGLKNYIKVLADYSFISSFFNTVIWVIFTLIFPVFGGLLIAFYIRGLKFENFYKTIIYVPFTISFVATGVIWTYLYGRDLGVLNGILALIGVDKINWLTNYPLNNFSLIVAWTWQQMGVNLVLYLMGLSTIPKEPVESAMIEGASKFQIFIFIIIPMLKPISVVVITMAMVNSFKVFDLIYVVTRGGPAKTTETLAITMFRESFVMFNMGYGSAISIILTLIILSISFMYMKRSLSSETVHI
tara:strand:- start:3409 stop:4290 length:882 start_codon:yes stop_codon:yes gene_type:complete